MVKSEQPAKYLMIALRNTCRALCLTAGLVAITGCGDDKPVDKTDTEHFLSDQQKALEQSKAAAAAMQDAAAARARQTEDARTN